MTVVIPDFPPQGKILLYTLVLHKIPTKLTTVPPNEEN